MVQNRIHHLSVALFGLDEELSTELRQTLGKLASSTSTKALPDASECLRAVDKTNAQVIFCKPCVDVIQQLRSASPGSAIIAVSKFADITAWLDSIEAGASDYCASPFNAADLHWILESNLRYSQVAA